ncbi:MAG: zinc ribbon domain-containing protein [Thermodesulfobacteriota bacterium]
MPLYDFQCRSCGRRFEELGAADAPAPECPGCGGETRRLVSVGRGYRADADWIASVAEVADKDSRAPHVRAFLARPTRRTYREWMRGEGIRPLEDGEGRCPRDAGREAARRVRREVWERFAARRGR